MRARVFILSVVLSLVVSGGKHLCQSVDVQIKASSVTRTWLPAYNVNTQQWPNVEFDGRQQVSSLLKKSGIDKAVLSNLQSISNLSTVSKILVAIIGAHPAQI